MGFQELRGRYETSERPLVEQERQPELGNDVLCAGSCVQIDSKADRKAMRHLQMYLHRSVTWFQTSGGLKSPEESDPHASSFQRNCISHLNTPLGVWREDRGQRSVTA